MGRETRTPDAKIGEAKVAMSYQMYKGVEILELAVWEVKKQLVAWGALGEEVLRYLAYHNEDCITELGCVSRDVDEQCEGLLIWKVKQLLGKA